MSASNPSIMLDYPTNVVNGTDPVTSFEAKLEEFRRSDNERDELVKVNILPLVTTTSTEKLCRICWTNIKHFSRSMLG